MILGVLVIITIKKLVKISSIFMTPPKLSLNPKPSNSFCQDHLLQGKSNCETLLYLSALNSSIKFQLSTCICIFNVDKWTYSRMLNPCLNKTLINIFTIFKNYYCYLIQHLISIRQQNQESNSHFQMSIKFTTTLKGKILQLRKNNKTHL